MKTKVLILAGALVASLLFVRPDKPVAIGAIRAILTRIPYGPR